MREVFIVLVLAVFVFMFGFVMSSSENYSGAIPVIEGCVSPCSPVEFEYDIPIKEERLEAAGYYVKFTTSAPSNIGKLKPIACVCPFGK